MINKFTQRGLHIIAMATSLTLLCGWTLSYPLSVYAQKSKSTSTNQHKTERKKIPQKGEITLNFANADISTVIEAVSKFTGQNFIIDPRVKGRVTIISHRPMNADQIYQVFLSVLKVHGFAAIPGPDVVKIVPDVNAKQDAIDTLNAARHDMGDQMITQIIEVKHVNASQLVPILRPLVPQRGQLAAVPSSNVIIIADTAANIARLTKIIHRIDTVSGDQIELIPLQHASATEVVRVLTQLSANEPKAPGGRPKLVADDRTNSILISGSKSERLRLKALIASLDTPMEVGGNIHVVYLRNAVAKDLVPVLTGVSKTVVKGKAAAGGNSQVFIQADESTNALVITAPPDVYRSLRSVISQLDVRRAQVMVDAVIAEITTDKARELGIQWAVDGRNGGNAVGLVNFTLGTPITALANLTSPPNPAGLTVGAGNFNGTNKIAALLSALAADSHTNILSTPTLVTLDNHEASIVVGQNVPFVTGSYANTGGGTTPTNPFTTIQRQDVGLTLKIKPQINEGDTIKMDVTQQVSSIAPSSGAADIITNKREIKTSVLVDDGQIIVLGGLIKDDLTQTEQKVPGLGDIPLLGWLFRYEKTEKIKTDLMVFLHPTILKDKKTMLSLTSSKYDFIRAKQLDMRKQGLDLMNDKEVPVMPKMDQMLTLPPPYEDSAQRMELSNPQDDFKTTQAIPNSGKSAMTNAVKSNKLETPPSSGQDNSQVTPPFISDDNAGSPPQ
ncbi:MAG: type II secretion system secretin GspD [Gammaproteobacteria bacterium]